MTPPTFRVRWWHPKLHIYRFTRHEGRDAFCRACDHARSLREHGHPAACPVVLDQHDRVWTGRRDASGAAIWAHEADLFGEAA